MLGMILAAGFGTRLRPLTWSLPKPLVPLCNRPLLGWAIESYLAAGIDELIINVHHLPDAIRQYLHHHYGDRTIHISFEPEILGTGGALRKVRHLLEREEEFFLANGDTIQFAPYAALREHRRSMNALAALTLRHAPSHDRFTPVHLDAGLLTGFGSGRGEALMFSGSHAISRNLLDLLPNEEAFGIVDRVYQPAIGSDRKIAGLVDDGPWFDIGTPSRYLEASAGLLGAMIGGELEPPSGSALEGICLRGVDTIIGGACSTSVFGDRCEISGKIDWSIVWNDCVIGESVRLDRCIVADHVRLEAPMELRNTVICRDQEGLPADLPRHGGLILAPF